MGQDGTGSVIEESTDVASDSLGKKWQHHQQAEACMFHRDWRLDVWKFPMWTSSTWDQD